MQQKQEKESILSFNKLIIDWGKFKTVLPTVTRPLCPRKNNDFPGEWDLS